MISGTGLGSKRVNLRRQFPINIGDEGEPRSLEQSYPIIRYITSEPPRRGGCTRIRTITSKYRIGELSTLMAALCGAPTRQSPPAHWYMDTAPSDQGNMWSMLFKVSGIRVLRGGVRVHNSVRTQFSSRGSFPINQG